MIYRYSTVAILCSVILLLFIPGQYALAQDAGKEYLNNKYGMHIAKPHSEDIEPVAKLVNSNGGRWGYVTMVMQEDNKKHDEWQSIFNSLRKNSLIPIVRLATRGEGAAWRRPLESEAKDWADFLDGLKWVTKDRYIVLFNEPNHANEWGGSVDPRGYARVAKVFAETLEAKNPDFFVMAAGLDDAAPQAMPEYGDSGYFLREMIAEMGPESYTKVFEGIVSRSYPNPAFAGSPLGYGKGTVRSYQWQLEYLKNLGIKEKPVFILETGWSARAISRSQIAQNLVTSFSQVWIPDSRIRAVTPFVFNYPDEPFLQFSWKGSGSDSYSPQYYSIQELDKVSGEPQINERGSIIYSLPSVFVEDSNYRYTVQIKNEGQGYWDKDSGYRLLLKGEDNYVVDDIDDIEPGESQPLSFYLKTSNPTAQKNVEFTLMMGGRTVLTARPWKYRVVPLPSLKISAKLFPKVTTSSKDFEVQIFNAEEEIVYKKKNVSVSEGIGVVQRIRNVALGQEYRVVLLLKGYLPRQTYVTFVPGETEVVFERMLPLDLNGDGALDWSDVWRGVTNPGQLDSFTP